MREKVLKVVKELNYHPNALARGLKSQRTKVIGILLPDIINPFSANWFVHSGSPAAARLLILYQH